MNFKYSDKAGIICDEIKWVPGPLFIHRRRAVVDIIEYYINNRTNTNIINQLCLK